MAILNKNDKAEVDKYNQFMKESPYKALTQDLYWSQVKKSWGNEYVYVEKDKKIIAAISILIKTIPGGFSLLYAPRGPVCDLNDVDLVNQLIKETGPLVKKYKAFALKMDPEVIYSEELVELYAHEGYVVKGRETDDDLLVQPRKNMIVYLEGYDAETIMSRFSKKNRNLIRSAGRKGVYTTWADTDEYIQKFYKTYAIMAERNEITKRDIDYFYKLRDAFKGQLRIYLTHHDEDILSSGLTINYYGKMYYLYAGSTNIKRNYNPNQLMNYEMIKWGLDEKALQYDLGGVFSMDEKDGLYGFKKQFCEKDGMTEYIGEIDIVFNKFLYYLYTNAMPALRKIKKKIL